MVDPKQVVQQSKGLQCEVPPTMAKCVRVYAGLDEWSDEELAWLIADPLRAMNQLRLSRLLSEKDRRADAEPARSVTAKLVSSNDLL